MQEICLFSAPNEMTDGWDGDETTEKRAVNQSTAVEDKVKSMTVCLLAAVVCRQYTYH